MKTKEEFKQIVSDSLWQHIRKNGYLPPDNTEGRNQFCERIYNLITNREYHPSLPREYVIADKHNGSTRLIPVFTLDDTAVYYYCVKALEDYLAEGYVDCTFGGFRLNGKITDQENNLFNEINAMPVYGSEFSYNPTGWVNAWRGFQYKAFQISREEGLNYFVSLDIGNFYPSINLALLENKIRNSADKSLSDEIDLLFYFLKYWDRKIAFYSPRGVGIPMDDFGDSSRLLANFFLQEYDRKVYDYCQNNGAKYLRFADDQVICTPDKAVADKIIRFASLELSRIGLYVNSGKIKRFDTRNKFEKYWAFEIFIKLDQQETLEEGIKDYLSADKNNIRWVSVLRRIIGRDLNNIDLALKSSVFAQVFDPEFLTKCGHRELLKLYGLLDTDREKNTFLNTLQRVASECLYTEFHYSILVAKNKGLPITFEEEIRERINELRF